LDPQHFLALDEHFESNLDFLHPAHVYPSLDSFSFPARSYLG
jgi:hypothetical protein